MSKYFLHGSLIAKEDKGGELAGLLIEASKLVANAKGCHFYVVSIDEKEPETVWVTEVWESKEDHENSLKTEAVRTLISKAIPMLAGQPQRGHELSVLGGHGLN
jgi:quinol monooxygenase YgiN